MRCARPGVLHLESPSFGVLVAILSETRAALEPLVAR